TGPDIIFFWVARMIMAGYAFNGQKPFSNVYFTGTVRDKLRRKMSKSLGNSPDLLALIDKFGADGVRMGIMLCSPAGNDILFDESLVEQGRNFCNKIWNAYRLIAGWEVSESYSEGEEEIAKIADKWFTEAYEKSIYEIHEAFDGFKISEALMIAYKVFWDDFCSWYLEMIKPAYGKPVNQNVLKQAKSHLDKLMHLIHPFMPFITEEIHAFIKNEDEKELIVSS